MVAMVCIIVHVVRKRNNKMNKIYDISHATAKVNTDLAITGIEMIPSSNNIAYSHNKENSISASEETQFSHIIHIEDNSTFENVQIEGQVN